MRQLAEKLVLGTVQFGLDYGINSAGRPNSNEVAKILNRCQAGGVKLLDTAHVYGNSEELLGLNWPSGGASNFKIITKLPPNTNPELARTQLKKSLKRLGTSKVYGLLFHRFSDYQNNHKAFDELLKFFKEEGLIQYYGFSLYEPEEVSWLIENAGCIDIVQVPYSVLDRRFESMFAALKKDFQTEIHVRSVFLQGLYFKRPDDLPSKLQPLKVYLMKIQALAIQYGVSQATLLMSFAFQNELIDGILTGVDNASQLKENLAALEILVNNLPEIPVQKEHLELLNPANWKD